MTSFGVNSDQEEYGKLKSLLHGLSDTIGASVIPRCFKLQKSEASGFCIGMNRPLYLLLSGFN